MIEAVGLRKQFPVKAGYAAKRRFAGSTGGRRRWRIGRRSGADASARTTTAVAGVDLYVEAGEIFGFLGPNGAGKTTTVRMLATLLRPDAGQAKIAGFDLLTEPAAVRQRIGYVSQAGGADPFASPVASLMLQARLHGMNAVEARCRTDEMLERMGLTGVAQRPAISLSGGQQRRLAVALGLTHRPELLFLDEPTIGLDPVARAGLWDEVRQLNTDGTTIFLTTHYLEEADSLCHRLGIIDTGRIVAEGTPAELKRAIVGDVLQVPLAPGRPADLEADLGAFPFVRKVSTGAEHLRIYVDDTDAAVPAVRRALESHGLGAQPITLMSASLDDVFLEHTGRSIGDGAALLRPGSAPSRALPIESEE